MEYTQLAGFFDRLEQTSKRLEMTGILVEILDVVTPEEMEAVVRLLQGKVAPDWDGLELGLAEKLILQVLARTSGMGTGKIGEITKIYHDAGDLGAAAEQLVGSSQSKQVGLMAFGEDDADPLTVIEAFSTLVQIAKTTGSDSQSRKQKLLESLLGKCGPLEAKFIIRTVAGRLRLGVADMTFLDALAAWHQGQGVRSVTEMEPEEREAHAATRAALEQAFDLRSDLAVVATTLANDGLEAVAAIKVQPGIPLRPMAAERLKTLGEILDKHEGRSALEYKYDGLRLQCHVSPDGVRLFSRRMEDLTDQFPDVQEALQAACKVDACIVEGEAVAVDEETLAMRPFQEISRRRGRKTDLGAADVQTLAGEVGSGAGRDITKEIPVRVFLFDALAIGEEALLATPYLERRDRLAQTFEETRSVTISAMEIAEDEGAMEAFFARAVDDGAEGIMCKATGAPYKAGNRGFDWIKYKTDYTEDLVDTMDLVVIGAFYGRGRRAGWYGALLMACFDPDLGQYTSVCKLGTGFDDETLKGLKDRFKEFESPERPHDVISDMIPDVWFHPTIVMEVQAAELSLSPVHKTAWSHLREGAGLAARFPRFSGRWRDDKGPENATTAQELVRMYEEQGKK